MLGNRRAARAASMRPRRSFDQLENERVDAVTVLESVNRRDIGMVEHGQYLCFTREPRETLGVAGEDDGQDFQCDVALERRVPRAVHLTQPATPSGETTSYDPMRVPAARAIRRLPRVPRL